MFKVSVDRLSKEELEYEIKIRGITETGTVDNLRKRLRSLLLLEKATGREHSIVELDAEVELQECGQRLVELSQLVASYTGSGKCASKIETKFSHLTARIDRISEDPEYKDRKSKALLDLTNLLTDYDTKRKIFKPNVTEQPLDPNFEDGNFNPQTASHSTPTNRTQVNPIAGPSVNLPNTSTSSNYKIVPVWKWDIKFSGSSGLSFIAFLQRVDELCISRGVDKHDLFRCAHDLFEGDALNYFHLISNYANDWDSLVKLMREEFVPSHLSDKLWQQILQRTQGSDEPIGIYVAAMSKLFDRMPTPVSDSLRLKVLRSNILPFFQERLTLHDIDTPFELIDLCRRLEQTRLRVGDFRPPKKGSLSLEPDLDYNPSKHSFKLDRTAVHELDVTEDRASGSNSNSAPNSGGGFSSKNNNLCFKCNQPNHFAKYCKSGVKKCFGCGKIDFTIRTCPNCSKSKPDNPNNHNRYDRSGKGGNNFNGGNSGNGQRR